MIPTTFDIATLCEGFRERRFTPVDIASEALLRIAHYGDPAVWISRVPEGDVIARAKYLREHGDPKNMPLYGIPFAVKDNIDCAGIPTTAACPAFAYVPPRSAYVVARLEAAGAILLGKTNLDQFATGLVGTRSPYGAPRSVFDPRYISGGSSSGSAVAVAAGLASFALGTDTAGSGRVPAAFNSIIGLKPSRGLISTSGVVPACRSLDCVSIFAGTVVDALSVLQIAAKFDPDDPYSQEGAKVLLPQESFRFGVLALRDREFFGNEDYSELYAAAAGRLSRLGGTPLEIDFSPFRAAGDLLYEGAWIAERYAAIKDFIAHHEADMDPTVRTIICGARKLSAIDAFEGQYGLATARRAAEAEWRRIDLLLLPTVPAHYTVDEVHADPIGVNAKLGRYTNFVNLLDCCAVAVPAGSRRDGLPFGVTLVAPAFADEGLAKIADRLHRSGC